MRLVDCHCHLESDFFKDRLDGIIEGARQAGVVKLLTSSITPDEWPLSRAIANRYKEVEFALGVHPWYCRKEDLEKIGELANAAADGAVAIGEIGLDKKSPHVGLELQKSLFEAQLKIAREIDLPVVIHCRGAFDELLHYFKRIGLPRRGGIIHSFSGSVEIAAEYARYGASFSFGGAITFRNSKRKAAVLKHVYPERIVLETDSPDIPPVEAREMPNVPANILYALRAAAEILGVGEEQIAETTTLNAARIFNLVI